MPIKYGSRSEARLTSLTSLSQYESFHPLAYIWGVLFLCFECNQLDRDAFQSSLLSSRGPYAIPICMAYTGSRQCAEQAMGRVLARLGMFENDNISLVAHGKQTLGWAGYVKVDGATYTILGTPGVPDTQSQLANQTSAQVTSL